MTATEDEKDKPATRRGKAVETVGLLVVGVAAALLLQAFVIGSFWIPSESMEKTLEVGDRVIVNKLHGATERGDVVVFTGWHDQDTIKRVIAVAGDTVVCCDAQRRITVNGVPIEEKDYLYPGDYPSGDAFKETVPPGHLWVMGDHRSASSDSRDNGTVPEDQVVGRAFAVYWPFSRAAVLSRPETFAKIR
ncbi:hypothetical protein Misp01_00620 [Microtetraspora sp. NBRC 13810]|uniref:signal peptidase I n=1 Tax=Microtetraspora sp. NBRC 13810 TaxID=3030990 RepID=UPI0024A2D5DB|nr:signal peptidase I [Microtetraspora sp. NBRC 13810]GLW04932.1 hypothetical protein Misp01_00620 [Microtetraspora sp. NBRC 13810]